MEGSFSMQDSNYFFFYLSFFVNKTSHFTHTKIKTSCNEREIEENHAILIRNRIPLFGNDGFLLQSGEYAFRNDSRQIKITISLWKQNDISLKYACFLLYFFFFSLSLFYDILLLAYDFSKNWLMCFESLLL